MKGEILLMMLFLHIVDDFHLQGILANLKQKAWWEKNAPGDMYKGDYAIAMLAHGFSWACMVMAPLWYFGLVTGRSLAISVMVLGWSHCEIDDAKCNRLKISLCTDQLLHVLQIVLAWAIFVLA